MVVTKTLFWTDTVIVFGLLVTDFGPGCYDHLNYNHLSAVQKDLDLRGVNLASPSTTTTTTTTTNHNNTNNEKYATTNNE